MTIKVVKNNARFLVVLVMLAFVLRAIVFCGYLSQNNRYWQVDSNTYHLMAEGIAQGRGINRQDGQPQFYRVPGYSIFISAYYKLFGSDTKNVLWLQVLLGSFIPLLIFFMSLTFFSKNILLAKLSSLYSVFHLGLVLYSGFFMTETLFIFFLLLFSILFFRSVRIFPRCSVQEKSAQLDEERTIAGPIQLYIPQELTQSHEFVQFYELNFGNQDWQALLPRKKVQSYDAMTSLLFSGIFLGCASLIRPVGHYLLVCSFFVLWLGCDTWKNKVAKNIALAWGWLAVVFVWLARNWMLTGYIFFHTLPGGHFLYLSAARVAMHVHNTSYQEARGILMKEANQLMKANQKDLGRPLQEIESCIVMEKLSISYFVKKPFIALKNWMTDILRSALSLYSAELIFLESGRQDIDYFSKGRTVWSMFSRYLFPKTKSAWLTLIVYIEMLLYLFILIGFLGSMIASFWNEILRNVLVLVFPFCILFLVISLSGGYSRMRLPIEPWLIILAWWFWLACFKEVFSKKGC